MEHFYDEFSKSLAASVPRRESLRRMGAVFAGAVFSQLGLGTAWGAKQDPCKAFCNRCSNTAQKNQCLAACRACNGNTSRLAGSCGKYVCCQTASCNGVCSDLRSDPNCGACGNNCYAIGETCCGNYCADLANDVENCGKCGTRCDLTGPYEVAACVAGACVYECVDGADDCGDGTCTYLGSDPNNCGACRNVCAGSTPFCTDGKCTETYCNGADLMWDGNNCGACGYSCQPLEHCSWGICEGSGGGDYGN
ncbi:MAG: hypothetical protein IAF94_07785 [Pirellulaceae bacterium]|nr:hypothetical protein [Pirellulaceae bacterium]